MTDQQGGFPPDEVLSFSLDGMHVVVTGGARGLGLGIARAMCSAGASVTITDVLDDAGQAARDALVDTGFDVEFVHHDVRRAEGWADVIADVTGRGHVVACLVNNAGVNANVDVEHVELDAFQHVLDVNLFGPLLGMQAVIPGMRSRAGGSIVNIASNATRKLLGTTTTYAASKAALASMSKSASIHLGAAGTGIRVNTIHPGPHATEMVLGGADVDRPWLEPMIAATPAGRLGHPSDVGAVAVFLASPAAAFVTGAEIFVDGGLSNT